MCRGSVHVLLRFFGHFSWSSRRLWSATEMTQSLWMERTDQTRDYLHKKRYNEFHFRWKVFGFRLYSYSQERWIQFLCPILTVHSQQCLLKLEQGFTQSAGTTTERISYTDHVNKNIFQRKKNSLLYTGLLLEGAPDITRFDHVYILHASLHVHSQLVVWSALGAQEFTKIWHQSCTHLFLRYGKWTKFTEECALALFTACSLLVHLYLFVLVNKYKWRTMQEVNTSIEQAVSLQCTIVNWEIWLTSHLMIKFVHLCKNFGKFFGT